MSARAKVQTTGFEPSEVAGWIGLADASVLGTQLIELSAETAEKLRAQGARAELTPNEAGAILHASDNQVRMYTLSERVTRRNGKVRKEARAVVLGHRHTTGGRVRIPAGDLAAFIVATTSPPVRTTDSLGIMDMVAARTAAAQACKRHNLKLDAA